MKKRHHINTIYTQHPCSLADNRYSGV